MPAEALVEVAVEDPRWDDALGDPEALARDAAGLALRVAGLSGLAASTSFLFADDDEVAALNAQFRGKPTPTNVLSWPAWDLRAVLRDAPPGAIPAPPPVALMPADWPGVWAADGPEPDSLGDVALAYDTVSREADTAGRPFRAHALHLCVHGVLHLLGYDHERDGDAALMEGLERQALLAAGLSDPYLPADDHAAREAADDHAAREAADDPAARRSAAALPDGSDGR